MARMDVSTKRWIILILICCINLCAGSIYAWSVLSAARLRSSLSSQVI